MVHQIVCEDAGMDCAFVVQSESDDELVEMAKRHGEREHNVEMEDGDVRDLIKPA
ncbi:MULTISPECIES: DUF1059 domain-containing protein [Halobaculum]|uniref:DUF1059 domain-containing protein n=1 Tax=Halobaculum TaxID=43927 RepID=UPI001CA423FA|nr:DUF1059 domain-containing protein [Halobaculum rubrum]QZX99682.1 DUF1059 domain-containing protein [Halobaculum rubrum]